jgi:hypothetical protein
MLTVVLRTMRWDCVCLSRVKDCEAVLYDQWPDLQVFRMAVQKAKEKGFHKWSTACVHRQHGPRVPRFRLCHGEAVHCTISRRDGVCLSVFHPCVYSETRRLAATLRLW